MPEFQVVGPVDFAHPAFADKRHNPVTLGDFRSRQKPAVMRTVGQRGMTARFQRTDLAAVCDRRLILRFQRSPAHRAEVARSGVVGRTGRAGSHGPNNIAKDTRQFSNAVGAVAQRCPLHEDTSSSLPECQVAQVDASDAAKENGKLASATNTSVIQQSLLARRFHLNKWLKSVLRRLPTNRFSLPPPGHWKVPPAVV